MSVTVSLRAAGTGFAGEALVVGAGAAIAWLVTAWPASLPVWAPYEFTWAAYLGLALPALWYARGMMLAAPGERPGVGAIVAFALGVGLIWAALLTRFTYWSQHAFFLNRLQHLLMHHAGPFLVALAWPGRTIRRGMPSVGARVCDSRVVGRVLLVTQQPVVAGALFAGLVWFWLRPPVHFVAMLSPGLYDVMNATMVVDGLLFWFLVLDPRPAREAGCSYPVRLATALLVVFPQLLVGSALTFTNRSLYASYDLCGRLFPGLTPIIDQHAGGVLVWIAPAMMSAIAFLVVINHMRREEDRGACGEADIVAGGMVVSSSAWTGR